jgi:hypothetical protein
MKYIIKGLVYILFITILIIWDFTRWLALVLWTFKLNPNVEITDKWGDYTDEILFSTHIRNRIKQIKNKTL